MKNRAGTLSKNFASFLMLFTLGIIGGLIFLALLLTRRAKVRGRRNLRGIGTKNVIFISNHPSYLETVLIPFAISWPALLIMPRYIPWQTPAADNFWFIVPIADLIRCVPIKNTGMGIREDPAAYRKLLKIMGSSRLLIFPEGRRSSKARARDDLLCETRSGLPMGNPRLGLGALIDNRDPTIVPIFVRGAEKVSPVGSHFPRLWRSDIEITIGQPFRINQITRGVKNAERRRIYANQAMQKIIDLD